MTDLAKTSLAAFQAAGAERVQADILQPADVLLDLYGEDIRGRAYVTDDPVRGEMMLRPDFTVPVVQGHMNDSAEPARYCYAGPVFRMQENQPDRPSEYMQVGYEVFDRGDAAAIEAEVFGIFQDILAPYNVTASTGDVGLLIAAVDGLSTSDARKAALKRHIWRPARFDALLARFSNDVPAKIPAASGPQIGVRSADEVADRWATINADAKTAPLDGAEVAALRLMLKIKDTFPKAMPQLELAAKGLPSLHAAVDAIAKRFNAFAGNGIDTGAITFQSAYGLSAMEYYDGFVFGFYGQHQIASGGRYDALTRMLGQGRSVPAVGGVLRPELLGAS